MQAVILAGGRGTRLGYEDLPKSLVKIEGVAVLKHQIMQLRKYNITNIVICTKFLSEKIMDEFGDGFDFGVNIRYSEEPNFLGTAGAVKNAEPFLEDEFFVIYGDVIFNIDITRMLEYHNEKKSEMTLFLHNSDHPYDSTIVEVDADRRIIGFIECPAKGTKFRNLTSAAFYIMKKSMLELIPSATKFDFAKDMFPRISEKQAFGYISKEYIKDMGTPERLEKVARHMAEGKIIPRKAVFFDRDGVINEHIGLLHKTDDLKLLPGAAEAIRKLNKCGILAIVVTNQPVVARNLCTEEDLAAIHEKMRRLLAEKSAYLDALYYCPHHPEKQHKDGNPEYRIDCECRKPKTGMIIKALEDFNLDIDKCMLMGDSTRDIKTGINAGCKTILVKTGEGGEDGIVADATPDFITRNINTGVELAIVKLKNLSRK